MTIYDEQVEKFGSRCKWLDCDCDFHYTKCVMGWARREALIERMEELGLKHIEFAYKVFSDSCYVLNDGFKCFEKNDEKTKMSYSDEDDFLTELEKEALEIAREELKDDDHVRSLYNKGKAKYIEAEKKRISELNAKLMSLENEIE